MKLQRFSIVSTLIAACWLMAGAMHPARAQLTFVVNSLADDDSSHAWDDPQTPDIDESKDGTCEDMRHECSARAAIDEAWNMNEGHGVPLDLTINMPGTLNVNSTAPLSPPDGSYLHGDLQTTIGGGFIAVEIGHATTVHGLKFDGTVVGISIKSDGNTISGNTFSHYLSGVIVDGVQNVIGGGAPGDRNIFTNCGQGILLTSDDNVVIGNYIGIDAQGNVAGNLSGVFDTGNNNTIGGTGPGMRNIISGNTIAGITVSAADLLLAGVSTIIGNYIGTDTSGTESRPNEYGIQVSVGRAIIGGAQTAERNIISGNNVAGIETRGNALTVRIIGNDIGLDVAGKPLGNRDGIDLSPGSFDCLIKDNRISNNRLEGIFSLGTQQDPSWNHRIHGNEIAWNGEAGIILNGLTTDVVIGSSLTQDFDPNHIHDNAGNGVEIFDYSSSPRANTIRKNDFHDNKGLGIGVYQDLAPNVQDGIKPPTIQNYTDLGGGVATVTVTHHRPGSLIDVYTAQGNQTSHYEGRQWLGSGTVVDSLVPFGFAITACSCTHIVATATDPAENTSEFSDSLQIPVTDVLVNRQDRPTHYSLADAYPNPFNPVTTIEFGIPKPEFVTLKIYDVLGKELATLVSKILMPGRQSVTWNSSGMASGVYFYRLNAGLYTSTKKMLLAK